jgi:hypothetical protein
MVSMSVITNIEQVVVYCCVRILQIAILRKQDGLSFPQLLPLQAFRLYIVVAKEAR